jgi:hypothetical protein
MYPGACKIEMRSWPQELASYKHASLTPPLLLFLGNDHFYEGRWGRRKEFEKKSRLPNLVGKKSGLKIGLKKGRIVKKNKRQDP